MKRVLILFLFLIPIVNAISIDNIPYNTYNLGDNLFVSGTADSGFVFLTLNCNDQMSPLGNIVVIKGVYSKIVPLTKVFSLSSKLWTVMDPRAFSPISFLPVVGFESVKLTIFSSIFIRRSADDSSNSFFIVCAGRNKVSSAL